MPADDLPADVHCLAEEPSASANECEAQFEAFYRRFFPILVSSLIFDGATPPLAADIAQATMKKAWASWSKITNPEAWARKTARREYFRQQKASNREVLAGPVPVCALLTLDDKGIAEFEERHVIIWVLRQLPSRQREVMFWTLFDYEPSEIALILRISPEAVRSSLMRARRKVAELLFGSGEEGYHVR